MRLWISIIAGSSALKERHFLLDIVSLALPPGSCLDAKNQMTDHGVSNV